MHSTTARPYGKSASMPLFPGYTEGEADQDQAMEVSWRQVLQDIQTSPGYRVLTRLQAFDLMLTHRGAADSAAGHNPATRRSSGTTSSNHSTGSDETVKPDDVLESGVAVIATPRRVDSQLREAQPRIDGEQGADHNPVPQLSPYARAFEPSARTGGTTGPSQELVERRTNFTDGPNFAECSITEYHHKRSSALAADMSNTKGSDNVDHIPGGPVPIRLSSINGAQNLFHRTPNAREPIHHRRVSSRFAFVPVLPSPLGPGRVTDDLYLDVSGLVPPTSATAPLLAPPKAHWHGAPATKASTPTAAAGPAAIPLSWTQHTPTSYSPFDTSPASDPFIDRGSPDETLPASTPHGYPDSPPPHPTPQQPHAETDTGADTIALRRTWIQTQTQHLTSTARAAQLAQRKYNLTSSPQDHAAWLRAQAVFLEAWDLQRLVAQRRELTLPRGMKALRIGKGNVAGDGMCGMDGDREGGVLGFRMAVMERVCAEIMVGRGENDDGDGSGAEGMSAYAKRAVRKAVMSDVAKAVERRRMKKKREEAGKDGGENGGEDGGIPVGDC